LGFGDLGFLGLQERKVMKDGSGVYYETTLQNSETLETLQFWFYRFRVLGFVTQEREREREREREIMEGCCSGVYNTKRILENSESLRVCSFGFRDFGFWVCETER
jgi:hypothetical protein